MRLLLYFTISLLFTGCMNAKNTKTETMDSRQQPGEELSDQEIIKLLQNEYKGIEKDDLCIEHISAFKGLVLVGFFAHDRGCSGDRAYYFKDQSDLRSIAPRVLKDHGWKDENKRMDLALEYTIQVIALWESVVHSESDDFSEGSYDFSMPASRKENNKIIAEMWIREPSGMRPVNNYYFLTVVFDEAGKIQNIKRSKRFETDMN